MRPIARPLTGCSLVAWLLALALLSACQTSPNQVFIEVDGGRQLLTTQVITVREALAEAKVELGPLDRVKPDLYAQLEPGLTIVITRVKEEIETKREIIPFERNKVVNEALGRGETRLSQLGVNGEEEVSIRVVYENGVEVNRTEVSRVTVIPPSPEILVVGPQGELPSSPVEGTIAYISNGNAWLMRDSSASRRPLTTEGDLDGRVFTLAPNGRQLLFSRVLTDRIDLPLNELWLASTTIVGEKPITVGLQGVLYAEWSPVITQPVIAYSTAERTPNPPGWRANNDLWLLTLPKAGQKPRPVEVVPANTQGLYPWWGATFAWSPDGTRLAYARADQIGLIELNPTAPLSSTVTPVVDFAPLKTFSEWVWVPGLSWSPDGQFLAATVHGPPQAAESPEESQVFDLWLFGLKNGLSAKVAGQVGMWANPAWGPAGVAFGRAVNPLQSVNSRYFIDLIDRDGSNKRQLFPFQAELGVQLPELVWSSTGDTLLFNYNGNLYLLNTLGSPPRQLTTDGQASHIRWLMAAPLETKVSGPALLTATATFTAIPIITSTQSSMVIPTLPITITRIPAPLDQIPPSAPIGPTATLIIPVNPEEKTRN